jgi:hypothetical protein
VGEGLRDIVRAIEVESTWQASAWTNEKRLIVTAQAFCKDTFGIGYFDRSVSSPWSGEGGIRTHGRVTPSEV